MTITLGSKVEDLQVLYRRGYGHWSEIINDEGPWSVGATLELVFSSGQTWTATIVDDTATFVATKLDTDPIPFNTTVALLYILNGISVPWAVGRTAQA